MIKNKAELEGMEPPPDGYWDPAVKRNRAKRLKLFARLLEIGLFRPRLKGTAKYFLGIFFVNSEHGSTFFTIYPFIRKNYHNSEPPWRSAREELVCFLGLVYFLQSSWRLPGVALSLPLTPALVGMQFVLGSGLNTRLPSTGHSWNVAASSGTVELPPDACGIPVPSLNGQPNSLKSSSVFSKSVVISQKWRFGDDLLLREARALFRGLQVMVGVEHVCNARVLCLTDSLQAPEI